MHSTVLECHLFTLQTTPPIYINLVVAKIEQRKRDSNTVSIYTDPPTRRGRRIPVAHLTLAMHTQVTVNPENSRVLVASNANDTIWVLDVGDGECAVLELQVTSTCSK